MSTYYIEIHSTESGFILDPGRLSERQGRQTTKPTHCYAGGGVLRPRFGLPARSAGKDLAGFDLDAIPRSLDGRAYAPGPRSLEARVAALQGCGLRRGDHLSGSSDTR